MRKESLHNGPAVGPGAYNNLDNSDQENEGKQEGLGATKGFDETESPETGDGNHGNHGKGNQRFDVPTGVGPSDKSKLRIEQDSKAPQDSQRGTSQDSLFI